MSHVVRMRWAASRLPLSYWSIMALWPRRNLAHADRSPHSTLWLGTQARPLVVTVVLWMLDHVLS